MTEGILQTIREWTGDEIQGCPWHVFSDSLVRRVLHLKGEVDAGVIALDRSEYSRRELDGVTYFHQAVQRITAKQLEERRKELERK